MASAHVLSQLLAGKHSGTAANSIPARIEQLHFRSAIDRNSSVLSFLTSDSSLFTEAARRSFPAAQPLLLDNPKKSVCAGIRDRAKAEN